MLKYLTHIQSDLIEFNCNPCFKDICSISHNFWLYIFIVGWAFWFCRSI